LGQTCVLTGWGRNNRANNNLPTILQEMETTVITRQDCQDKIQSHGGDFKEWFIVDSHICFYNSAATACHGDSGGPAVCKKNGKWVLAGLTSGGNPYCAAGFPDIYTRVSEFRDYIKSKTGL